MPRRNRNRTVESEIWYRAEVSVWEVGTVSLWGGSDLFRYESCVDFLEYPVVRRTPRGVYLRDPNRPFARRLMHVEDPDHHSNLRWVSTSARKRFAYPTKQLALASLKIRKQIYTQNCERRLREAQQQEQAANEYTLEENEQRNS